MTVAVGSPNWPKPLSPMAHRLPLLLRNKLCWLALPAEIVVTGCAPLVNACSIAAHINNRISSHITNLWRAWEASPVSVFIFNGARVLWLACRVQLYRSTYMSISRTVYNQILIAECCRIRTSQHHSIIDLQMGWRFIMTLAAVNYRDWN